MICVNCGLDQAIQASDELFTFECENCWYRAEYDEFLNGLAAGRFVFSNMTSRLGGDYLVQFRRRTVAKLSFTSQNYVKIQAIDPSLLSELLVFLRNAFKNTLTLTVKQDSATVEFKGCAVCGGNDFRRDGDMMVCVKCADHRLSIPAYLYSRLLAKGYLPNTEQPEYLLSPRNRFFVKKVGLLQRNFVDAQLLSKSGFRYRLLLRQVGTLASVEELATYLRTLNLDFDVVVIGNS